jgi:hypothetical protein
LKGDGFKRVQNEELDMKVSNFKISKLVHYVENNMVKEGVEKHL